MPLRHTIGIPVKLALVISDLSHGGAERQVVELARHLHGESYDVSVIVLSDHNPLLENDLELKQRVTIIPKSGKYAIGVVFKLAKLLRERKIEIVHGFLFDAEMATRLAGWIARTPVVIGSERNSDYCIASFKKILLKLTGSCAHYIIGNSWAGVEFNRKLYGFKTDKYRMVHNGVDTQRFHSLPQPQAQEQAALNPEELTGCVIGMFASFKPQKNHPLLFTALGMVLRSNPNFSLLLVGDTLHGNFRDTQTYMQESLKALEEVGIKDKVHLMGRRDDLEKLYPSCNFTVLPSNHEGMPNVLLESMACAVPVVATNVADNSLIIRDKINGLIVARGDAGQLAVAILKFMQDAEYCKRCGLAARESIEERFSNQIMVSNMSKVYAELLEASHKTSSANLS